MPGLRLVAPARHSRRRPSGGPCRSYHEAVTEGPLLTRWWGLPPFLDGRLCPCLRRLRIPVWRCCWGTRGYGGCSLPLVALGFAHTPSRHAPRFSHLTCRLSPPVVRRRCRQRGLSVFGAPACVLAHPTRLAPAIFARARPSSRRWSCHPTLVRLLARAVTPLSFVCEPAPSSVGIAVLTSPRGSSVRSRHRARRFTFVALGSIRRPGSPPVFVRLWARAVVWSGEPIFGSLGSFHPGSAAERQGGLACASALPDALASLPA